MPPSKTFTGTSETRKKDAILKEFTRSLSDDDLKWLLTRLNQRLGGDLGEAVEAMQGNPEVDRLFSTARDSSGLYDLIDEMGEYLDRELRKRAYTPAPSYAEV